MSTLTEIAEYADKILRLDLETAVRGFDGETIGPANEQAQVLANRTLWLKTELNKIVENIGKLEQVKYVASVNKETGNLTITYETIGAAARNHPHVTTDIETSDEEMFVSADEKKTWDAKQEVLVSGETLKTVLGQSLLGNGNISIRSKDITTDDDQQFVSKNDKSIWSGKQPILVSGESIKTLHNINLLGSGNITLSYENVGADKKGASNEAVNTHVLSKDPHSQYLTKDRGDDYFLDKTLGNQPNGFLQLNESGGIPPELADLFKARYITVENEKERLEITIGGDITICLQLDENIVYYLDGGVDPSINENWKKGRNTDPSNIISVYGRTGVIEAATGDYNTSQITETENKLFTTPDEKKVWNAKQDTLISGTSIKTLNKDSLLGKGDIEITPESIKAANETHTHSVSDITTSEEKQFISSEDRTNWDAKQKALVSGDDIKTLNSVSLLGSGNIEITPKSIKAANETHKHSVSDIETDSDNQFVSADEKKVWNAKQDTLISGTSIKTLNKDSLLGSGNIEITPKSIKAANETHKHSVSDIETDSDNQFVTQSDKDAWDKKQDSLISGKNVSTVFGQSLLLGNDITLNDVDDLHKVISKLLAAGKGIDISLDDDKKLITITNTGSGTEVVTPDPIRVETVEDPDGNSTYVYRADKANYDFIAYALKKSIASNSEMVTFTYDEILTDLPRSEPPAFDETGFIPESISGTKYALESVSTDYESFSTSSISLPNSDITRINIDLGGNGKGLIPPMMSDTNGNFTVFASIFETGYEAWKSFQYNDSLGELAPKTYWRSPNKFSDEKILPSIGVKSTEPLTIDSFGLQDFTGFKSTDGNASTYPTEIMLQGRDVEGGGWTSIERWTNVKIVNTGAGWNIFQLSGQHTYKQFQLLLRNAASTSRNVAISRIQFYNGVGGLIKDINGNYYTVDENNSLVNVVPSTTMFEDNNFGGTAKPILVSDIASLFPIKICSNKKTDVVIKNYITAKQIVIHFPLETTNIWSALNNLVVGEVNNDTDKLTMRTAITIDGVEYLVFKDGAWKSIGELKSDLDSAKLLDREGMLFLSLSSITQEQWELLFIDGEITYELGIAYSSIVGESSDAVTPKTLNATFNEVIQWAITSKEEVRIFFQGRKIGFTTSEPGTYKFCYRFN